MSFRRNWWIYFIGLATSILLVGLYFINIENPWCIASCSTGASLFGAVILAGVLDLRSDKSTKLHNSKVKKFSNLAIYQSIMKLLMVLILAVRALERIEKKKLQYSDLNIEEFVKFIADKLDKIKLDTAPMLFKNEEVSDEEMEQCRLKDELLQEAKSYSESMISMREEFQKLLEQFKTYKHTLLISEVMDEKEIMQLESVLKILGPQEKRMVSEEPLFEYGESLREILDCKLIATLEMLGMDKITFNNSKGYFDIKEKSKR